MSEKFQKEQPPQKKRGFVKAGLLALGLMGMPGVAHAENQRGDARMASLTTAEKPTIQDVADYLDDAIRQARMVKGTEDAAIRFSQGDSKEINRILAERRNALDAIRDEHVAQLLRWGFEKNSAPVQQIQRVCK
jgi:hypothetical protein